MAISFSNILLFTKAFCGATGGGSISGAFGNIGTMLLLDDCGGMRVMEGGVAALLLEDSGS